MSDKVYDLIITGQLLPNSEKSAATTALAKLLKVDEQRSAALLSGKPQLIKKSADEESARKFIAAFKRIGVQLAARPISTAESPEPPADKANDSAASTSPEFGLSEIGAELLAEDERSQFEALDLNPDWEILEAGEPIETLTVEKQMLDPDTSGLSLANEGEVLPGLEKPEAPPVPDTSHLRSEAL